MSPRRTAPRLPIQPLLDATGATTQGDMAALLGVQLRRLSRWIRLGGVPVSLADDLAVRAGAHPVEIWPNYHDVIAP